MSAKISDLLPSGLTEAQYATLAVLCLDQAGLSLLGQQRLLDQLHDDGIIVEAPTGEAEYAAWVGGL